MTINFYPNDPLSTALPMRKVTPRDSRSGSEAGFAMPGGTPDEAEYDPVTQVADFLPWQCREAALAALEMYESVQGAPLAKWARSNHPRRLQLLPNEGPDLNAFYDGQSLSFFEFNANGKPTYSGMSTDVVAHEAGHAILDALRPDLWASNFFEVGAIHEAIGDCVAILTALNDGPTRDAVLAKIDNTNFVETTAEDLSDSIKRINPNHNAAEPRRHRNTHQWEFPSSLPTSGGPGVLIQEIHTFGMIFSGCFYDLMLEILNKQPARNADTLLTAAKTAGQLLFAGVLTASETPRFFRSVGRAMTLADEDLFGGANRVEIRNAFGKHNIVLGSNGILAPVSSLSGAAPKMGAHKATLSSSTLSDLRVRLAAPKGAKFIVDALTIAGEKVARAVHRRAIQLAAVDKRLKGVVAHAAESTLVGNVAGTPAVMDALPDVDSVENEVLTFVESLIKTGSIAFDGVVRSAMSRSETLPTHVIRKHGATKVLERVRFACKARR